MPMLLTDPSRSFGTEGTTTFVSSTVSRHASFAAGVALSAAAFTALPRKPPTLSNRTLDISSLSLETTLWSEDAAEEDADAAGEGELEVAEVETGVDDVADDVADADFVADFVSVVVVDDVATAEPAIEDSLVVTAYLASVADAAAVYDAEDESSVAKAARNASASKALDFEAVGRDAGRGATTAYAPDLPAAPDSTPYFCVSSL